MQTAVWCHLGNERLGIAEQDAQHVAATRELLFDSFAGQPVRTACTLHDGTVGRGRAAHDERDAYRSVVADHGDFRRRTIFQHIEKGNDHVDWKIDIALRVAGLIENRTPEAASPASGAEKTRARSAGGNASRR